jgi:hypothetical protein
VPTLNSLADGGWTYAGSSRLSGHVRSVRLR